MKNEEIEKELVEKIYKKLVHAMLGPNGEPFGAVGESYLDGLIMAYRIVESFDPKPEPKMDEIIKKLEEKTK
jgi:hypothetical protein